MLKKNAGEGTGQGRVASRSGPLGSTGAKGWIWMHWLSVSCSW